MITKNPMQLKAFIKKKAAEKNISAQLVMQNYMLERLLERISLSKYKHNCPNMKQAEGDTCYISIAWLSLFCHNHFTPRYTYGKTP